MSYKLNPIRYMDITSQGNQPWFSVPINFSIYVDPPRGKFTPTFSIYLYGLSCLNKNRYIFLSII